MVAYASRSNNKEEANYYSYEGETLAVVWGVTHCQHFLYGRRFTPITDHQPLKWLLTNNKLTSKHARWLLILQEYDFTIKHRPGLKHVNGDTCSRNPLPTTAD